MGKKDEVILGDDGKPIISDKIQKELEEIEKFDKAQQNLQKQMDERANGKSLKQGADKNYVRQPPKIYGTHRDLGLRPLAVPILAGLILVAFFLYLAFGIITKKPMLIPEISLPGPIPG